MHFDDLSPELLQKMSDEERERLKEVDLDLINEISEYLSDIPHEALLGSISGMFAAYGRQEALNYCNRLRMLLGMPPVLQVVRDK